MALTEVCVRRADLSDLQVLHGQVGGILQAIRQYHAHNELPIKVTATFDGPPSPLRDEQSLLQNNMSEPEEVEEARIDEACIDLSDLWEELDEHKEAVRLSACYTAISMAAADAADELCEAKWMAEVRDGKAWERRFAKQERRERLADARNMLADTRRIALSMAPSSNRHPKKRAALEPVAVPENPVPAKRACAIASWRHTLSLN